MLQSASDKMMSSELTTDNTGKEIELSISPFVIENATNISESTANEVLNHHWTFYIEVGHNRGMIEHNNYERLIDKPIQNTNIRIQSRTKYTNIA